MLLVVGHGIITITRKPRSWAFLVPTGAQGVTMSARPSVKLTQWMPQLSDNALLTPVSASSGPGRRLAV